MRALAAATEKHLGKSIVVENRSGAAGTSGPIQMAMTAKPDGYTVSQIPLGLLHVALLRTTKFDPRSDLTYIIGLTGYTFGVVVRNEARWRTFEELLADAKSRPGKVSFASAGVGTMPHMVMAQIAKQQGIDWTHVPFRGSAEVTNAILGGHIDAAADASTWGPMVSAGKLRLLVTWGPDRTANWPTTPTLKEIGIDIATNAAYGLAGPKGMDPTIVRTLHDAFMKGAEDPSYRAVLARFDQQPNYMNSADYRTFAMGKIAELKSLVAELGLQID